MPQTVSTCPQNAFKLRISNYSLLLSTASKRCTKQQSGARNTKLNVAQIRFSDIMQTYPTWQEDAARAAARLG